MAFLSSLVPVFALLAIGVAARRLGLLSGEAANGLNRLVANVALPALLLLTIGTASLAESASPALMAACAVLVVAVTVVAWWLARALGLPPAQRGVTAQAATRGNLAYVAFPVVLAAHGDAGLRLAAVTAAVLFPLMNFVGVGALEAARGQREAAWRLAWRVLKNPLVFCSLAGLALAAAGWRPWGWLAATLRILSDFALPGALLTLGAQLSLRSWHGLWRPAAAAAALKMVVQPLGTLLLLRALGLPPLAVSVGVLLMAAPTAVATYPVAAELGGDTDLAAACVVTTTLAALPVYLVIAAVLAH
jgi:predicted permease